MWPGLSLPHITECHIPRYMTFCDIYLWCLQLCSPGNKVVDIRDIPNWSLILRSGWSDLIKAGVAGDSKPTLHPIKYAHGFVLCYVFVFILWPPHHDSSHYWPFVWGIHRLPVDSLHTGQVQSCDVFFVFSLNKLLNKPFSCRQSETPWHSCDVTVMFDSYPAGCLHCVVLSTVSVKQPWWI